MALIEIALARALTAYGGRTDKAGQPYILHPLRLMARMPDTAAQLVALLHDVIEDAPTSAADLLAEGMPAEVVEAVVLLTRLDGESYADFIERIRPHRLARMVKLADIEDNLDVLRLASLTDEDMARVKKYHQAWHRLASVDKH
ncbi:GTP pyrophosphokinase [Pseudomonas sp. RIT-PI-AD]|uniref:GTP pyrophosphokinase n=1 Tax=Pseudomonas sp. RIT-PI-AD TaxID=3035294 RepID=UPI0021DAE387|nr:GTP pyrophosphokinase [Pseudomonas sp. RIT-PI-AD]